MFNITHSSPRLTTLVVLFRSDRKLLRHDVQILCIMQHIFERLPAHQYIYGATPKATTIANPTVSRTANFLFIPTATLGTPVGFDVGLILVGLSVGLAVVGLSVGLAVVGLSVGLAVVGLSVGLAVVGLIVGLAVVGGGGIGW